jgi:hypothetical protein
MHNILLVSDLAENQEEHDDEMPNDIGKKQLPTSTSFDNQGAKRIAESIGPAKRWKHTELQHFYGQEKVQD